MSIQDNIHTTTDFWEFVNLPENADRFFERIRGEIFELMPSNPYSSAIASTINFYLKQYVIQHPIGHVTGEQGGYNLTDDTTIAPDVAFISKTRQLTLPQTGFTPQPPDLAVKVISPSDLSNPQHRIQDKITIYREVQIPLLWLVYPNRNEVEVYIKGELHQTLDVDDSLDGGDVLPDFTLAVKNIFA